MTNPAAQARAKAQAKWPGATVHGRGKNWIKHQHPTNPRKLALDTHIGPIHYGASEDQEIDTAWVTSTGAWDYESVFNDFHCFVRDSVPVGYRYLDVATDEAVDLDVDAIEWVNDSDQRENVTSFSQVTPTIDDDSITWPDIATGWDVTVQAQTARLAKKIIIDSLANLGSPTLTGTVDLAISFRFQMSSGLDAYIDGELWDKNSDALTSDHIEFRSNGDSVFWFKRPWATDSTSEQYNGSMFVHKAGANLFVEVRIPWTWLQAAGYPIEIDPTIEPQVGANNDDFWWTEGDSDFGANDAGTPVGYFNGTKGIVNVGYHFRNISSGLDNTTVSVAYMIYIAHTDQSLTTVNSNITAVDAQDPTTPTDYSSAESASRTDAFVAFDNIGSWTAGGEYNTSASDMSTVIQELIDTYDYSSGTESILVYHEDDGSTTTDGTYRQIRTYDDDTSKAAKLHIEYTSPTSAGLVRAVRQPVNTATGNQDFNVPGWSATPQAALYLATYGTADNSAADHSVMGIGLAVSSSERHTVSAKEKHGVDTTDTSRRSISDECIAVLDPANGTIDGEADFVQFNAGGSRVNWGDAPSAAFLMTALYFSGFDNVDLQKVDASGSSPQTITVGFQADIVLIISNNTSNADVGTPASEIGMGLAVRGSGQGFVVGFSGDNKAAGAPSRGIRSDNFWGGSTQDSWSYRVSIGSFTSTGFDLTTVAGTVDTTDDWFILSLKLPSGVSAWCGSVASPTSSGDDPQTGPGFKPQTLLGILTDIDSIPTWAGEPTGLGHVLASGWAITVATESEQFCHCVADEKGSDITDAQSLVDDTLIHLTTHAGTDELIASLVSFDTNGWTPNYSTFDATPRYQIWLAIEEDGGPVSILSPAGTPLAARPAFLAKSPVGVDRVVSGIIQGLRKVLTPRSRL